MTSGQVIISRKLQSPEYNEKYKTELCRNWISGFCSFDSKCVFAHGKEELREKSISTSEEKSPSDSYMISDTHSPSEYSKKRLPVFVEISKRLYNDID